jgi:steroid 5-alpha reductase family enzyme
MTALTLSLAVLIISIILCFTAGLITRNYSQVDRLWSILPVVYAGIWLPAYSSNPRYLIASALVLLWGTRLTVNFALKGGYAFSFRKGFTGEDYRWDYLQQKIGSRVRFELFNLLFISTYQLVLIFLFTYPLYHYGRITGSITRTEYVLYALHALLLLSETISDSQQLRFYRRRDASPWSELHRYQLGFNTFGFWKYSRHPNYVCEIGQWVIVYLYLAAASGTHHWSMAGALLLMGLFAGSTAFTERITSGKYPEYTRWRQMTSVWIPFIRAVRSREERREFLS